jgi:hypothetical protein
LSNSGGEEAIAVGGAPAHGDEDGTGENAAGVVLNTGNDGIGGSGLG